MALKSTITAVNDGGSGRGSKTPQVYDPTAGKWRDPINTAVNKDDTVYDPTTGTFRDPIKTNPNPSPQKTGDTSKNSDSKAEAEKEYIETEFNILTGEMKLTPTTRSIRLKVNDTVKVEGLGKYLSGLYFVSAISRNISASGGYSQTITLLKNGFGSSVKQKAEVKKEEVKAEEPRKEEVKKESTELKVGDTVRIVGDDATYANASKGVKVPEWVKKKDLTIRQISDDKTRVLVMPITSWTYVKYIVKV